MNLPVLAAKLALFAAVFAICLALGEVAVRLIGYRPIFSVYSKPSIFWRHDPLLGWSHEPNSQATYVGPKPYPVEFSTPVRINALGLRGPEVGPRRPDGVRVLFLGDSMVAAFEVEYEATFAVLAGQALGQHLGVPVEVINAGVRGYGTDQTYLYFRDSGHELQPDLVVLVYSGNDPRNNIEVHRMLRPFGKGVFRPTPEGGLELIGTPVPRYPMCSQYTLAPDLQIARTDNWRQELFCRAETGLLDRSALFTVMVFGARRHPQLIFGLHRSFSPEQAFRVSDSTQELSKRVTEALLRELGSAVRRTTGRKMLIVGDDKNLVGFDPARVADDSAVFSYEAIYEESVDDLKFKNDSHFTKLGHERVARLLTPVLAEHLGPSPVRLDP